MANKNEPEIRTKSVGQHSEDGDRETAVSDDRAHETDKVSGKQLRELESRNVDELERRGNEEESDERDAAEIERQQYERTVESLVGDGVSRKFAEHMAKVKHDDTEPQIGELWEYNSDIIAKRGNF